MPDLGRCAVLTYADNDGLLGCALLEEVQAAAGQVPLLTSLLRGARQPAAQTFKILRRQPLTLQARQPAAYFQDPALAVSDACKHGGGGLCHDQLPASCVATLLLQ